MTPREQVIRKLTLQWLQKAEQDLAAARTLLHSDSSFSYPACFHAQQAAEKYLKGYLTWKQVEFPKTHSIEKLLDLVAEDAPEVASTLEHAAVLSAYGVEIRYPSEQPEPTTQEARRAVDLVEMVRQTLRPVVDPDDAR